MFREQTAGQNHHLICSAMIQYFHISINLLQLPSHYRKTSLLLKIVAWNVFLHYLMKGEENAISLIDPREHDIPDN